MPNEKRNYMETALEIGFSRLGRTSPNPSVGAVIVKNNRVISTGGTSAFGSDHAELVSIKSAGSSTEGAEMYVSLEPCCHHGKKTPPCTDAIIAAKISRVYIPILDPNPAVTGRGVDILREAGIDVVIMSEMSAKAYDLIRQFRKYILHKKPFVIHKAATTIDGRIAAEHGDSKWISDEYSRFIVHRLRSKVDAIIIGKNTFIKDDPLLNVRLDSFPKEVYHFFNENKIVINGRENFFLERLLKSNDFDSRNNPLKVILGIPEKIESSMNIMNIYEERNLVFFVKESKKDKLLESKGDPFIKSLYESGNIVFIKGDSRGEQINSILDDLYIRGRMLVMLEGGGSAAGSFFNEGCIDQFIYFITPRILGGGKAVIEGCGKETIKESKILHDISSVILKNDLLYNAYSEPTLGICEEVRCLQD